MSFPYFAFGFLLLCQTQDVEPKEPRVQIPTFPLINYLMREEVSSDLKLDEMQRKEISLAFKRRMAEVLSKSKALDKEEILQKAIDDNNPSVITTAEKRALAEYNSLTNDAHSALDEDLATVLTPDQMDRLLGIIIQAEGPRSLLICKQVRESLSISEDQYQSLLKIESTVKAREREILNIKPDHFLIRDEMKSVIDLAKSKRSELDLLRRTSLHDMLEVLAKKQQVQFEKMKGKPFTFKRPDWGLTS